MYVLYNSTTTKEMKKMQDERRTNIQVKVSTREKLALLGRKGQTYDDIINELIHRVEEE